MFKFNSFTKKAVLSLSAMGLLAASQPARAGQKDALTKALVGVIACAGLTWKMDNDLKKTYYVLKKQKPYTYNCCLAAWAISVFVAFAYATGMFNHQN